MSKLTGERLLISCREATYLISRNREKPVGIRAIFRLIIHLLICEYCRRFREQTKIIEKAAAGMESGHHLDDDEKRRMAEVVESEGGGRA